MTVNLLKIGWKRYNIKWCNYGQMWEGGWDPKIVDSSTVFFANAVYILKNICIIYYR